MKKVALIGCGAVSQLYYAPALHQLEKNEIIKVDSILDPDPDNRIKLLEHFPDAIMVNELSEIVERETNLSIIASPADMHAQQSIGLLKNGINVFCEKPLSTNSIDAAEMIKTAKESKSILGVGLLRRHFPSSQVIRKILDLKMLGELKTILCQEGNIFRWPVSSASYFEKSKGGVLMDIGTHVIDLLIWWLGQPENIYYEDDAVDGVEVNCRIKLLFRNNVQGEIRLSRDTELLNKYIFYGTKAWMIWEVNDAENVHIGFYDYGYNLRGVVYKNNQKDIPYLESVKAYNFHQCFTSQLMDVLSAIENNKQTFVPIEEALSSLKIIEYCYQNRNFIKMPWLTENENQNALKMKKEMSL